MPERLPRGLSRIDTAVNHTHGYRVFLQRGRRKIVRLFSDGTYGGKRKARRAAQAFLQQLLAKHPPLSRAKRCAIKRRNNRSGVPGVTRYTDRWVNAKGQIIERDVWIARIPDPERLGKAKLVKFRISTHGVRGAFRLAVARRRDALRDLAGR